MVVRVWLWALHGEMVQVGSSGEISRSLLHLSFQTRNVHSDIIIRKSRVAPLQMWPSWVHTFMRGRAMIIVMSGLVSQGIFLHSQITFASFQIILFWFASQLKRICCIVSGVSHKGHIPLSLNLSILSQ